MDRARKKGGTDKLKTCANIFLTAPHIGTTPKAYMNIARRHYDISGNELQLLTNAINELGSCINKMES